MGTPPLTNFPELTADAVMGVVGLVLEERDDEIARLRAACEEEERTAILGEPPPGALL